MTFSTPYVGTHFFHAEANSFCLLFHPGATGNSPEFNSMLQLELRNSSGPELPELVKSPCRDLSSKMMK